MIDIAQINPWWEPGGINQDRDLRLAELSPLKYDPIPFSPEDMVAGRIYTLRGARRVGKTVSLKLFVKRLLEEHRVEPRSIGWWNADTSRRADILESQLIELLEAMRSESSPSVKTLPPLLIVDEVTSVIQWQRALKRLKDQGLLDNTCVILTGSSAHDLKIGTETMAGRRGIASNLDRVLHSMSFSTFRSCAGKASSLSDFLKVGGYPFRVEEYIRAPKTFEISFGANVLEEVFMYEVIRRGLDRSIALEVLVRIAELGVTATSYDSFAKALSSTKDTARTHLDALGDGFLLCTYASLDLHTFRAAPRKARKFLWFDPAFRSLAHILGRGPIVDEAAIAESVVGAELIRRYEAYPHHGYSNLDGVFTWKSSTGHEVDFIAATDRLKSNKNLLPVEVKYKNSISEWDWKVLEKSFGKGILVTKNKCIIQPAQEIEVRDIETFLTSANALPRTS